MATTVASSSIFFGAEDAPFQRIAARVTDRLGAITAKMQGLSTISRNLFVGIGGSVALGTRSFANFERGMSMVSTMLNDDDMSFMDAYRKGIKDLAKGAGESTDTLAKGLYDILSASIAPADALNVLAVATKAAKGGFTEASTATSGMINLLNSYGLSATEAARVSDLMFASVKRGQFTYSELASNVGKISPMSRVAGLSMEEMLAMIATLTRQGLSADEATTRLVAALNALASPQDTAKKAAAGLGITLNTSALRGEQLTKTLSKLKGMSLENLSKLFPEVRAASGIAILSSDIEGLKTDLSELQNSAGQTERAFSKAMNSPAAGIDRMKAKLSALGVTFGESMSPVVEPLLDSLGKLAEGIGNVAGAFPRLTRALIVGGLAVTGFTWALPKLTAGLGLVNTVLMGIIRPATVYGSYLTWLRITSLRTGVGIRDAFRGVGGIFSGIASAVRRDAPIIGGGLRSAFSMSTLTGALGAVRGFFSGLVTTGQSSLTTISQAMRAMGRTALATANEFIRSFPAIMSNGYWITRNAASSAASSVWQSMSRMAAATWAGASSMAGAFLHPIRSLGTFVTFMRASVVPAVIAAARSMALGVVGALTFLAAHPVILALTAVVAALTFVFVKWKNETLLVLTIVAQNFFWAIRQIWSVLVYGVSVAGWFATNFLNILWDMSAAAGRVLLNLGKNLWNFFGAVKDWILGRGWNFKWTGLLEGFKATVSEFPAYAEQAEWGVEKSLGQKAQSIADRIAGFKDRGAVPNVNKAAKGLPAVDTSGVMAAGSAMGEKANFIGLEEGWKKLATLGMGKSPEAEKTEIAKKGLSVQEQQLTELKKLNSKDGGVNVTTEGGVALI